MEGVLAPASRPDESRAGHRDSHATSLSFIGKSPPMVDQREARTLSVAYIEIYQVFALSLRAFPNLVHSRLNLALDLFRWLRQNF